LRKASAIRVSAISPTPVVQVNLGNQAKKGKLRVKKSKLTYSLKKKGGDTGN